MSSTISKEKEFQARIAELEKEISILKKRKKYGLVWEDKPEDVVAQCQTHVPVLSEVKSRKTTDTSKVHENLLIEGDNYHALSVLNYTHRNKIDVIYIDPPYNTGNKDFTYNDKILDHDDTFKHSKWLSFMNKRLKIARNLLSEKGLIFISISDHEVHTLRMLMDKIFGENNFLANIIWNSTKSVTNTALISVAHTYNLVYAKNIDWWTQNRDQLRLPDSDEGFNNPDNDPRGPWKADPFQVGGWRPNQQYQIINPNTGKSYSPNKGNSWKNIESKYNQLLTDGRIVFGKNGNSGPQRKRFLSEALERGRVTTTLWNDVDTTTAGTQQIKKIFGETLFSNPKPTKLIKRILELCTRKNKTSVVLDFFAGSGTTGHAVLELNKEDGGNRQFILCTNNENKIAEEVTYPRIKKVIQGYGDTEGLGGALRYYKTKLVDIEKLQKIPDERRLKLTYQAGEMIAIRENTLDETEKNEWWQIFENNNKTVAIYFQEDKQKLRELVKKISNNESVVLYVFSWGKNEYKNEFAEYPNIRVEDIPEPIIEVYKEINRLK